MKRIILICFMLFIGKIGFSQKAIGLHPFDKEISLRSNLEKKNFWDYRLAYDVGFMDGYGYVKYRFEINWNRRSVNLEQLKVYWGLGFVIQDFIPQFLIPIGIEFFPLKDFNRFSISTEVRPEINFAFIKGSALNSDIAVRYYFKQKKD